MQDIAIAACRALHTLVPSHLIFSGLFQTRREQSLTPGRDQSMACCGWWPCARGSWMTWNQSHSYFIFPGRNSWQGIPGVSDGWSWSLLSSGMFWFSDLATTGSKSVLHLPYLSPPTCCFLSHLSLSFPPLFHSKLCALRKLAECRRDAQATELPEVTEWKVSALPWCWRTVTKKPATSKE